MTTSHLTNPIVDITNLLVSLAAQGTRVWLDGERIRFMASGSPLSPADTAQLREQRDSLIDLLRDTGADWPAYPASFGQRALWYAHDLTGGVDCSYHLLTAVKLKRSIGFNDIKLALEDAVNRNEILRTTYAMQFGALWQRVRDTLPVALHYRELGNVDDEHLRSLFEDFGRDPFDLAEGPVFRAMVVERCTPGTEVERTLVFCAHHIAMDFGSLQLLLRELAAHINGSFTEMRPGQFRDFAARQLKDLSGDQAVEKTRRLLSLLQPLPPTVHLGFQRSPSTMAATQYPVLSWELPLAQSEGITALASNLGTTIFGVCLAAYAMTLSRIVDQDRLAINIASTLRRNDADGLVLGNFANLTPFVAHISTQESLEGNVKRVFEDSQLALNCRDVPFPLLVEAAGLSGSDRRSPVTPLAFSWHRDSGSRPEEPEQLGVVEPMSRQLGPPGSLMLTAHSTGPALDFKLTYDPTTVSVEFASAIVNGLNCFFRSLHETSSKKLSDVIITEPGTFTTPLRSEQLPRPCTSALERILSVAEERPDSTAVVGNTFKLSYSELVRYAQALAQGLRDRGVLPGDRVAVHLDRGKWLLPAALGIWLAGAVYVPVDITYPKKRVDKLLEVSGAHGILVTGEFELTEIQTAWSWNLATDSPTPVDHTNTHAAPPPNSLAYIIFTSGSTGNPKGVAIGHLSLSSLTSSLSEALGVGPSIRYLAISSISFDASIAELFVPLSSGSTLVLAPDGSARNPEILASLIDSHSINMMQATPTTWKSLLVAFPNRYWCLSAHSMGEALPMDLAGELQERCDNLWNLYGPTEATVYVTANSVRKEFQALANAPVEAPLAGCELWILDACQHPVAAGVPGELYLCGPHLASGYWQDPQATANAFMKLPHLAPEDRVFYRTGDLARKLESGAIEIIGRRDHQVKVRGHRIELGEIEATLLRHPNVSAAAVVISTRNNVSYVDAFVCSDTPLAEIQLTSFVRDVLPPYMVPSNIVQLPSLPVNVNGKIDRKALSNLDLTPARPVIERSNTNETSSLMLDILSRLLGRDLHDADVSIFDLGADSLKAVEFRILVNKELNTNLTMADIFENPVISVLADISNGRSAQPSCDYLSDINLPIEFGETPIAAAGNPSRILLTGSTGYLGSRILKELLANEHATVVCLIRAKDADEARERLIDSMAKHRVFLLENWFKRVEFVTGALGLPLLGMPKERYEELAGNVDSVVHCGALVNFALPYASMRGNVLGTRDLIQFCGEERAKYLHFVSTYSVLDASAEKLAECIDVPHHAMLNFGYAQSKWVCEKLISKAIDKGLKCSIYRPSRIISGTPGDMLNHADFYSLVLAASIASGSTPVDAGTDNFVDVRAVARRIAIAALRPIAENAALHLCADQWTPWEALLTKLEEHGFRFTRVPYQSWVDGLRRSATSIASLRPLAEIIPFLDGAADRLRLCLLDRHPIIDVGPVEDGVSLGANFSQELLRDHADQLVSHYSLAPKEAA